MAMPRLPCAEIQDSASASTMPSGNQNATDFTPHRRQRMERLGVLTAAASEANAPCEIRPLCRAVATMCRRCRLGAGPSDNPVPECQPAANGVARRNTLNAPGIATSDFGWWLHTGVSVSLMLCEFLGGFMYGHACGRINYRFLI
jgi:hypothetical protein